MTDKGDAPPLVEVVVYGLTRRKRVRGLIDQLARIPCVPHTIFSIDRFGRELAVYDAWNDQSTVYVRVISWVPEVHIEWTLRPQVFGIKFKQRADKKIEHHKTTLNASPFRYELDLVRHAQLTKDACNN